MLMTALGPPLITIKLWLVTASFLQESHQSSIFEQLNHLEPKQQLQTQITISLFVFCISKIVCNKCAVMSVRFAFNIVAFESFPSNVTPVCASLPFQCALNVGASMMLEACTPFPQLREGEGGFFCQQGCVSPAGNVKDGQCSLKYLLSCR